MTAVSGRSGGGPTRPAVAAPGLVRLIGGKWKRTPLNVSDRPSLRPTPNRVRKTLFDWLGHDLDGWIVYDAFAGSGALGLEAGSRGAARVTLCEQDNALAAGLKAVARRLDPQALTLHVERGDGVAALRRQPSNSCDLVLLDPPFETGLHDPALAAAAGALRVQGRIYLEAPTRWSLERLQALGLETLKYLHAGSVHAHLIGRLTIV
ncbi:MAG: RsmD family RNA methyltransferase [Burkholderiaceae bacterium]